MKVGDIVTWRSGKSKSGSHSPLGIANCRILELGEAEDGRPAAKLLLPPVMSRFGGQYSDEINAYVDDLEPNE